MQGTRPVLHNLCTQQTITQNLLRALVTKETGSSFYKALGRQVSLLAIYVHLLANAGGFMAKNVTSFASTAKILTAKHVRQGYGTEEEQSITSDDFLCVCL